MYDKHDSDNFKEFITWYKQQEEGKYEKPSVTVDNIILCFDKEREKIQLLMIQRKFHPFKNCYCLPGGFVDYNESLEKACLRELKEETNITLTTDQIQQLQMFSHENRDPRTWIMSCAFIAYLPYKPTALGGDDALEAKWFDLSIKNNILTLENNDLLYTIDLSKDEKYFYQQLANNYQTMLDNKPFTSNTIAFDHSYMLKQAISTFINNDKLKTMINSDKEYTTKILKEQLNLKN